jgi:hypothetical protein
LSRHKPSRLFEKTNLILALLFMEMVCLYLVIILHINNLT